MDENSTIILPISDEQQKIDNNYNKSDDESFRWTTGTILQALVVFIAAGIAEIGGGYLVWKAIRGKYNDNDTAGNNNIDTDSSSNHAIIISNTKQRRWLYAISGSLILVLYGFIPTLQPTNSFGRIYAVYGGFFIVLSFLAGWYFDNDRPDLGDLIGGGIALVGVFIVLFWPR